MEIESLYNIFRQSQGVTTDSRKCAPGLMFFALKGEKFNGNAFAGQALEQGCVCAVIDDPAFDSGDSRLVLVPNTLQTLQALAQRHRREMGVPVIGITGTNGKTTTKELVTTVLRSRHNVLATVGNLNNSIGVPLTVLQIAPENQYAVVEMGASHPGDIKELVSIAEPDFGLITNVGKAHLLGFGSFEGVKATKGELYDFIRQNGGRIFLNGSNPDLVKMAGGLDSVRYGTDLSTDQSVYGEFLECNPFLKFRWSTDRTTWHTVQTRLIGAYNIDNALAAITIGLYFGVSSEQASEAVASYTPSNNRSQLTITPHNTLVVDAYNANPTSMAAAISNFTLTQVPAKMLILGDMRELGDASGTEHIRVVEQLVSAGFASTDVWLVGAEFSKAVRGADQIGGKFRCFENVEAVILALQQEPVAGKTILVKGSNSIGLVKLVEHL